MGKDDPHDPSAITYATLSTILKSTRTKYRQASGRRSGHGRVVLLYFEMCTEIWGVDLQ